MQCTAAAEGQQREPARVMTLADRYETDALGHLGVEDAVNAEGRLLDGEVQPAGDARHRGARKLGP